MNHQNNQKIEYYLFNW